MPPPLPQPRPRRRTATAEIVVKPAPSAAVRTWLLLCIMFTLAVTAAIVIAML